MRRREFIAGLGGAAIGWPRAARAQRAGRMRRLGVLLPYEENDPGPKADLSAFTQRLSELGWTDGRNLRMDVRWAAGNLDRGRIYAKELVGLQPDVLLADSTPNTAALQRETRTIPIVFVVVSDPVGSGFIAGLPRPGGNITGFIPWEPTMGGKWLQLLTEIAPGVRRIAAMFNPDTAPYVPSNYLPSFEAAARSLKVEPITAPVHSDAEIEQAITSLGREPKGGFVVMPDSFMGAIARQLYCWQPQTAYRRSTRNLLIPETAVCFPMDPTLRTSIDARRPMWIAFCVAPSRRTCPSSCQPNLRRC
jgi:putative ABC transport system substrate-binding protein